MIWALQALPDMEEDEFGRWRQLIEERTGMHFGPQQRVFLQTHLAMRMREIQCESYQDYYARVVNGLEGMMEWATLVDRLVVKETSFFRHADSYEFVRKLVDKRLQDTPDVSLQAWSVGCCTGEEAYSLALVLDDCYQRAELEPRYGVHATDISLPSLAHGREGVYSLRKMQTIPEHLAHYYRAVDDGHGQFAADLRERVCFAHTNVMEIKRAPIDSVDLIFCQNLLIYFRRWRRREILNQLVQRLRPGGHLVIALGEITNWHNPKVRRVDDERVQAYVRHVQ